jgi:hypothetical protein
MRVTLDMSAQRTFGRFTNARFWHMPALPRFMLQQTLFKTDVVFEGL